MPQSHKVSKVSFWKAGFKKNIYLFSVALCLGALVTENLIK